MKLIHLYPSIIRSLWTNDVLWSIEPGKEPFFLIRNDSYIFNSVSHIPIERFIVNTNDESTMADEFRIEINDKILRWAVERSGYTREYLFERIIKRFPAKYFTEHYYNSILDGSIEPKFSDIKKFDSFLKRGTPFYFIQKMPEEKILAEFRRENRVSFSPKTELLLRKHHELREEIDALFVEHGISKDRIVDIHGIHDDPIVVAADLREQLEYDLGEWRSKKPKEVFNYLRSKIEDVGIFVFKDDLVDGVRGCTFLGNDLPTLILIKSFDDKNGEIFTLLHEFAHYLLNSEDVLYLEEEESKVEKWCNEVTASFLMSPDEERKEGIDISNRKLLLDKERIEEISRDYKLSKNAIMLKYLYNGIISQNVYRSFLEAYDGKSKEKGGTGGNYHNTNRDRLSNRFITLVYKSYSEGRISMHDTMEYFHIKDQSRLEHYLEVI